MWSSSEGVNAGIMEYESSGSTSTERRERAKPRSGAEPAGTRTGEAGLGSSQSPELIVFLYCAMSTGGWGGRSPPAQRGDIDKIDELKCRGVGSSLL